MHQRQRGTARLQPRAASWPGFSLQTLCVLAACSLTVCAAQVVRNPFNVTNTGPIGATAGALLPRLSTYLPGTFFPNNTVPLGSTTFRWDPVVQMPAPSPANSSF